MKKVNLYFFRHGQTEWNRLKKMQGSHDIPLNETGKEQALELSEKLNGLPLDVAVSSDLSRAMDTAKIALQAKQIEIHTFSELREARLGDVEGLLKTELFDQYGEEMWQSWISPEEKYLDFKFPGGETKRETRQRAIDCLEAFLKQNTFEHIAVSTHGGVISRVVHFCEGAPQEAAPIPNGCLYHIVWDFGRWVYMGSID